MAFKQKSPLPILEGGTNTQQFVHVFGTAYFDGGSLNNIDPGVTGYVLTSNGVGGPASFQAIDAHGALVEMTADTGSAVPLVGVIDLEGGTNINTSAAGNTVTVNLDNTISVSGSITSGTGLVATTGGLTATAGGLTITAGTITTPFTSYGALVSNTSGVVTDAAATSGYVLTGNTASLPTFKAVTAIGVVTELSTDSGNALPSSGVIEIHGGSNINTSGSTNIVTVNLDNTVSVSGSVTAGTGVVATAGGLTATAGGLTVTAGTITTPFTSYGALVSNTSGVITDTAATSGYVLTGNTGSIPTFQALPPSTAYITWVDQTSSTVTMSVNTGYVMDDGSTLITATLPSIAALGNTITVQGFGSGLWTIAQNANQMIHFGAITTTTGTGGSISSNGQYDSVTLVCVKTNTDFAVMASVGNLSWV